MTSPRTGGTTALIVGLMLLTTACGGGDGDSQIQSGTVASIESTTTTEATTTSSTAATSSSAASLEDSSSGGVASAEAESFKALAPSIPELEGDVAQFVGATDAARIDELANDACAAVSGGMTDSELGFAGLAAYDDLTANEQSQLAIDDWVVLYGAMIGFFCPENLPDLGDAPAEQGGDIGQFRTLVTEIDGVSAETEAFVASVSDERIDELQTVACANTNADLSTEDFGLDIVESYGSDLSDSERDAISLSAYSELYGSLVGWFCPENLPG